MLYTFHEWQRALCTPLAALSSHTHTLFSAPNSVLSAHPFAKEIAAGSELLYRFSKPYQKPAWRIETPSQHPERRIQIRDSLHLPFCVLRHFSQHPTPALPKVLVVAPLSGHHASLLRDTVHTLLNDFDVYISDWIDARQVPLDKGEFSLESYVQYVQQFIEHIDEPMHIIAVCQSTVPVLAAVALQTTQAARTPLSLTLMGGPVDPRQNPTAVNSLATTHNLQWFMQHMVHTVPSTYPAAGRAVYPGFLQHAGFIAMNVGRHWQSHADFYQHLIQGANIDADAHRSFYDEYNAVMDIPAAFYLDTVKTVFQDCALANGSWRIQEQAVHLGAIEKVALLTIEGELDDISGAGQTHAAHALCTALTPTQKQLFTAKQTGHYGIFSGQRWRTVIYPKIRHFIYAHAS